MIGLVTTLLPRQPAPPAARCLVAAGKPLGKLLLAGLPCTSAAASSVTAPRLVAPSPVVGALFQRRAAPLFCSSRQRADPFALTKRSKRQAQSASFCHGPAHPSSPSRPSSTELGLSPILQVPMILCG
ncbi:uncharacterized protein [Triticum aestivum]|uniref:uncharacterized protein n=1 Tax=Triticum aestivum TaxID=4565 RepID=UPI001D02EBD6|nr:uncharacterized protein LOC123130650 [Triticum aestivum]XP_044406419.1 uncharacterized protein LOC123130650 [Triticum aestivum]